jgi:hypothetical protein
VDQLPERRKPIDELKHIVPILENHPVPSKLVMKSIAKIEQARKEARSIGEDLTQTMLSLDAVEHLCVEDRKVRKQALSGIEHLSQEVDQLELELNHLQQRFGAKLSALQMETYASQICMGLALGIGVVINSILVHLPRKQHFAAVVALSHPGGDKPQISEVRNIQEEFAKRSASRDTELGDVRFSCSVEHLSRLVQEDVRQRPPVQLPLTTQSRSDVIYWLLQAMDTFRLPDSSLFQAVRLLDRYDMVAGSQTMSSDSAQHRRAMVALASVALMGKCHNSDYTERTTFKLEQGMVEGVRKSSPGLSRHRVRPPVPGKGNQDRRRKGGLGQPEDRHRGRERRVPRK